LRLTSEQRAVVEWSGGHVLVEAVAGSGKTTVLVERNRKLLRDGVPPIGILNVMFNKDAASQFQERLKSGSGGALPRVMTFHALAYRLLNQMVQRGEIEPFELMSDERNVRRMMQDALQQAAGGRRGWGSELVDEFASFVTLVKAGFVPATTVWKQGRYSPETAIFPGAFDVMEDLRKAENLRTFDDLILDLCVLMQDTPEAWGNFTQGLEHLIVDEVQDVSEAQFQMMRGLTRGGAQLMAVGDSAQSIYGFRGASPKYILHEIPMAYACPRLKLSRTFRYGHRTALMASHGIHCNKQRSDTLTIAGPGTPNTSVVFVKRLETSGVAMLKKAFANGGEINAAVLARRFSDLVGMEIALMQAGVPYFVSGKSTRGLQREVAGLMAVLGWGTGCWGGFEELRRRQMSASMWRHPTLYLTKGVLEALDTATTSATSGKDLLRRVRELASQLKSTDYRAADRLIQRVNALDAVWDLPPSIEPATLLRVFASRAKLTEAIMQSATSEVRGEEAVAGVNAVLSVLDGIKTATEVMELMKRLESQEAKAPEGPAVVLTSIHRAKGLEFDVVMLASVGEMSEEAGIEEERRLTYVAVTRAKEQLWVEAPWIKEDDVLVNDIRPPAAPKRMPRWLEEAQILKSLVVGDVAENGGTVEIGGEIVKRYLTEVLADCEETRE
jgi:DNA helicase-2/ATP-dependent DNA helicase PcrA